MPNALIKNLELMFEEVIEGYDSACVVSREAETSYPDPQAMQQAGDTFYVSQDMHASLVTGLDVSAATRSDVIQRMVPTVYRTPDNVVWELNARELRDGDLMRKKGKAAALRLAAEIDTNLYAAAVANASIVVRKVGAFAWTDGATAEAAMIVRGIRNGDRKLFINPTDYLAVTGDLGGKAYMSDWSKDAYARSQVPDIASFKTFRTDNLVNIAAIGTVTGTTVTSNTSHSVTAMTGDVPTDNRFGTLPVSGANIANIKNGDTFTIANVNAVHMINKTDTGQPLTIRVISGGGTSSLTITPKIVTSGPYQNATAQAVAGAALTFLNNSTRPANLFWQQGAVSLDYGRLEFPSGTGAMVMTSNTKQGVPIVQVAQIDAKTGILFVRHTTLYAVGVRDPEKVGVIIANQT